ncbi:MAG: hypothetical protein QG659_58 [Patescibacteria group bacterium]|jgi:hypothetical protein|nr:hypothetical protein [Patescibacteria group bacterium]
MARIRGRLRSIWTIRRPIPIRISASELPWHTLITPDDSRRLLQEWLPSAHGIRYYSPVVNHYLVGDKYSKEVCDFP